MQCLPVFHRACPKRVKAELTISGEKIREITTYVNAKSKSIIDAALVALHPVVNGVQSIERKANREEKKRLTQGIGGVDSASFFDTSLFFRLVRRPGLKQGHLQKLCKE
jgi:hypothetical protein